MAAAAATHQTGMPEATTALAQAIPIIGPILGGVPAVLVAATVSPQLALIVLVVYVVLQIIEGNVLVPIVMRNTVGISPFLVVLSVLAGAAAGGFIGALLAVPIAATIEVVLEGLQAREVPVAQDPTATLGQSDDEAADGDADDVEAAATPASPAPTRRPAARAAAPD